jgi:hypothetical protein
MERTGDYLMLGSKVKLLGLCEVISNGCYLSMTSISSPMENDQEKGNDGYEGKMRKNREGEAPSHKAYEYWNNRKRLVQR